MEEIQNCPVCNSQIFDSYLSCGDHFLSGEIFTIVQCHECGFRFVNPRPAEAKLGTYYQSPDYISHSNSRKGFFNNVYQGVRKYTISRKHKMIMSFSPGSRILDIGCATGEFLSYMKSKGWDTLGIEPDGSARKQAIEVNGLKVLDEPYLEQLPDASFDVITLWHVLEHVADLSGRMKSLKRLLAPGGILVIAVPNSDSHDAKFYNNFWAGYDVPRHLSHFSPSSMNRLLVTFGFNFVKTFPMKFDAYYVSLLSEKYRDGKMRWLPGVWNGFRANSKAKKDGNYSSLIYVAKKY